MSAIVIVSVLAASSWAIDAGWNEPDNLQFLVPFLVTSYSLAVLIPLAAVVRLTRGTRALNSNAERWINLAVMLAAIIGVATWTVALIDQVRNLIITA